MPELARARSLPARWYWDEAQYRAERRAVFARNWLLFAHESELARPGDCRAETLAGWPLLVRRGRDGALRGFHNVCRHRAGPLVADGEAHCAALRCRYHGWTYDDEGRLERAPDFGERDDGALDAIRLFPLRVETWRGLVFVNLDPGAAPLAQALGRLPELAEKLDLECCAPRARRSHALRCNWKTYVENYLEGYHLPFVHAGLTREVVARDYRVEAGAQCVSHHVPVRGGADPSVYQGLWVWLAPNAALNGYDRGLSVERMLPDGPRAMRLEYWFLFPDGEDTREALDMCETVTGEDAGICEAVQRNLEAGVYDTGPLSPRHENGVHYFQDWLRDALSRGGEAGPAR